jgi:hypothetical protein
MYDPGAKGPSCLTLAISGVSRPHERTSSMPKPMYHPAMRPMKMICGSRQGSGHAGLQVQSASRRGPTRPYSCAL